MLGPSSRSRDAGREAEVWAVPAALGDRESVLSSVTWPGLVWDCSWNGILTRPHPDPPPQTPPGIFYFLRLWWATMLLGPSIGELKLFFRLFISDSILGGKEFHITSRQIEIFNTIIFKRALPKICMYYPAFMGSSNCAAWCCIKPSGIHISPPSNCCAVETVKSCQCRVFASVWIFVVCMRKSFRVQTAEHDVDATLSINTNKWKMRTFHADAHRSLLKHRTS